MRAAGIVEQARARPSRRHGACASSPFARGRRPQSASAEAETRRSLLVRHCDPHRHHCRAPPLVVNHAARGDVPAGRRPRRMGKANRQRVLPGHPTRMDDTPKA